MYFCKHEGRMCLDEEDCAKRHAHLPDPDRAWPRALMTIAIVVGILSWMYVFAAMGGHKPF